MKAKDHPATEEGQVIVLVALLLGTGVLIGFAVLVVDVPIYLQAKHELQMIADSAALAGAMQLNVWTLSEPLNTFVLNSGQANQAAQSVCDRYQQLEVRCNIDVQPWFYPSVVQVVATRNVRTFFASAIVPGLREVEIQAEATAHMAADY